jgi:hypothetical protein
MDSNRIFAGVDSSEGARHLTVAALSHRLEVKFLRELSMEDAVEELSGFGAISVAVGGPLRPNPSSAAVESQPGEARRGKTVWASEPEAEIRRRGISIRRSPTKEEAAPAAMRPVFQLARELSKRGFVEGAPARESPRFLLSTRPAACAAVLLGRLPFGRATLEGRIQRQLLLIREKVALPDPMDSLEEMTAHHLLSGRLSLRGILKREELDALLAAFTAWRAVCLPETVTWLGRDSDGWICLPAQQLLDKYIKCEYSPSA